MKRKWLVAFALTVLICTLTFSALAATVEDVNGNRNSFYSYINGKNTIVVFGIINDYSSGTEFFLRNIKPSMKMLKENGISVVAIVNSNIDYSTETVPTDLLSRMTAEYPGVTFLKALDQTPLWSWQSTVVHSGWSVAPDVFIRNAGGKLLDYIIGGGDPAETAAEAVRLITGKQVEPVYLKHKLTVKLLRVDDEALIAPSIVREYCESEDYSIQAPAVAGYRPQFPAVEGTMSKEDIERFIYYEKIVDPLPSKHIVRITADKKSIAVNEPITIRYYTKYLFMNLDDYGVTKWELYECRGDDKQIVDACLAMPYMPWYKEETSYTVTDTTVDKLFFWAGVRYGEAIVTEELEIPVDHSREYDPDQKLKDFVTRCYNLMLDRNPDTVGFAYWVDTLKNGTKTAAEIIKGFTDSKEFQGKKLRNEAAVEILYKTMLSRGSDAGGKAYWVKKLEAGQPLAAIINGFCDSTEFKKLCAEYGIKPGSVTIDPVPVTPDNPEEPGNETPEQRAKVEAFVTRCYSLMLNRNPDAGGLAYWTDHLCNGTKAAAEIINGFCVSTEFVNKNLSKEDSVEILYKTMLGRGSDAGGKAYWMNKLNEGQPYAAIINGFCVSNEFKRICSEYGITPGSVKGMEGARAKTPAEEQGETTATPEPYDPTIITAAVRAMNTEKAEEYVRRCYRIILGRDADQGGLETWVKKLTSGQKTPDQVARNFFSSEEFRRRTLNSEELVKMLYKVYLNREADASGLAAWKTKLDEGASLEDVIKSFVKSKEYKAVLEKMWK